MPECPDLPLNRVARSPPFYYIGLDYFGPCITNDNKKCWVLLITCMVTRAINLELV